VVARPGNGNARPFLFSCNVATHARDGTWRLGRWPIVLGNCTFDERPRVLAEACIRLSKGEWCVHFLPCIPTDGYCIAT
jgi:hypothetical protein